MDGRCERVVGEAGGITARAPGMGRAPRGSGPRCEGARARSRGSAKVRLAYTTQPCTRSVAWKYTKWAAAHLDHTHVLKRGGMAVKSPLGAVLS